MPVPALIEYNDYRKEFAVAQKRKDRRAVFSEINTYPFLLLLLFFALFFLGVYFESKTVFNLSKYLLIPISFVGMLFRIAALTPNHIHIMKSPILLLVCLTSYVFFAEATLLYNLWFGDTWGMFLVIPLALLLYSIYMKFNREWSAYYSGWNILLIFVIFVLIFITLIPCGYVPEWIPWTPFWQNVTTGPCL